MITCVTVVSLIYNHPYPHTRALFLQADFHISVDLAYVYELVSIVISVTLVPHCRSLRHGLDYIGTDLR